MIRVSQVSKKFRYWTDQPKSLKSVLVDMTRGRFLKRGTRHEFSALHEVSFEIKSGEFVGIMGRNGAGKSTLLKLLSGIYTPTAGTIAVEGVITPLIELGAGFHHELSGYENIFLNAAILGVGRAATLAAIPKIHEFSELGEKLHMPVKNYSSGMLVRLGFSIAAHLPSPILLIDEVLAVGDAGFQEKCIAKIRSLNSEGCTIVLITHDPNAVLQNCSRCIVIDRQRKVYDGPVAEGVKTYIEAVHTPA